MKIANMEFHTTLTKKIFTDEKEQNMVTFINS
jgi:hypothetical protein